MEIAADLEVIILSEVSQKEKNKHHLLTHMYGIYKDGIDLLFGEEE